MESTLPSMPAEPGSSIVQCAHHLVVHHTRPHLSTAVDPNATPVKRRPGRPKGSGKKQPSENPTVIGEKIKRPVGRPRKDGLPAGSVGTRRSAQSRKAGKAHPEPAQAPPGLPFPGVSSVIVVKQTNLLSTPSRPTILNIPEFPPGRPGLPRWPLNRLSRPLHLLLPMPPQVDLLINNTILIQISTGMSGKNCYGQSLMRSYSPYSPVWQPRTRSQVQDRQSRTPSNLISVR